MIVIPPLKIDGTRLIAASCTIPEPDASQGEVEWVASAAYTLGAQRVRSAVHRKFECKLAHTGSAVLPENDPINWFDVGSTNRHAMFDTGRNAQSIGPVGAPLVVSILPGQRGNALYLGRLAAAYATVIMSVGGVEKYRKVLSLTRRNTKSWSDYYFKGFAQLQSVMLLDLPMYANATITVELDNGSQPARCAAMVFNRSVDCGDSEWGAASDWLIFGGFERNDFGDARLLDRRQLPTTSQTLEVPKSQVDAVLALREQAGKLPCVFSGMNDKTTDGWFEMFLIYAVVTRFKVTAMNAKKARIDIDLEEY